MSPKKILLLHEDRLLTDFFREKLEAAGFSVEPAPSGEEGLAAAVEQRPDAVVLDPVVPGPELGELIKGLRAAGGARPIPVIVLATGRPAIGEIAQEAGADVVLARGANPRGDVVNAIQTKLDLEKSFPLLRSPASRTEEEWLAVSLDSARETLVILRRALQEASREGGDPKAMTEFFLRIHGFSEQMLMFGQLPLHALTTQIESLAFDLSKFPGMSNPSVVRTLGQAIDFLAALLPENVRARLKDPASAQVLVVDDEDGARKMIMTAMRLANLRSLAAETPSTGLASLGLQAVDLIFLDVGLPQMTGFELCTKIRMLPMHEKTPIIFVTGMATFQNRVQSSLSGGNDFVGKPFSLPELGLKALIWVFKSQLGQV